MTKVFFVPKKSIHLLFDVEEIVAANAWDWTQFKMSGKIPNNISTAKFSANHINKRDYDAYLQYIEILVNTHEIKSDYFTDKRRVLNMSHRLELSVLNGDVQ